MPDETQEREPDGVRWAREVVDDDAPVFATQVSDMRDILAHIDRLTRERDEAQDGWTATSAALAELETVATIRQERLARLRSVLALPVAEAMEYEGRLDASMHLSVDALNELRSFIALAEPEGAPALDTNSDALLARLDTLTPNELRRTLVDVLGERDVLVREVLLLRKATT